MVKERSDKRKPVGSRDKENCGQKVTVIEVNIGLISDCVLFKRSKNKLTDQPRISDVEKIVMKQGNSLHLIQYLFLHKKTMELGNEFGRHTKKI